jgi:TRAP-type mannitol/chloroaromatic compound transport system permease large subunit
VIPYVLVTIVGVIIIIMFPQIALYFPDLFFGKSLL